MSEAGGTGTYASSSAPAKRTAQQAAPDSQDARRSARRYLTALLIRYGSASSWTALGLDPDHARRMRAALATGGLDAAAAALPDELVARHTIAGTAEECWEQLREVVVDHQINYPMVPLFGRHAESTLAALAAFAP